MYRQVPWLVLHNEIAAELETGDVSPPLRTLKERKEAHALVKVDLETHSEQRSAIRVVTSALADLGNKEVQGMTQSKIHDFFK